MSSKANKFVAWGIVLVFFAAVIVGSFVYNSIQREKVASSELAPFAQCLADKGAVFYGAFWCPHCKVQKDLFGASQKLLTYVECSTPDGRGQLSICRDKQIEGYPTWIFADGSRASGEVSLAILSQKTSCELPQ